MSSLIYTNILQTSFQAGHAFAAAKNTRFSAIERMTQIALREIPNISQICFNMSQKRTVTNAIDPDMLFYNEYLAKQLN